MDRVLEVNSELYLPKFLHGECGKFLLTVFLECKNAKVLLGF